MRSRAGDEKKNYENILTCWRVTRRRSCFSATYCVLTTSTYKTYVYKACRRADTAVTAFCPCSKKKIIIIKHSRTIVFTSIQFTPFSCVALYGTSKQPYYYYYYYYYYCCMMILCAIPVQQWHLNGTSRTRPRPT